MNDSLKTLIHRHRITRADLARIVGCRRWTVDRWMMLSDSPRYLALKESDWEKIRLFFEENPPKKRITYKEKMALRQLMAAGNRLAETQKKMEEINGIR